ncbi:MAG: CRISPR-associated helicase Cas3' [Micavibrio sp.]|nr:MAG: CRISPR-associated helicase Cas3' [Micavibrio sp.]
MSDKFVAHIHPEDFSRVNPLEEHLNDVAKKAGEFAESFGNTDWAHLAGLWHDLGKYHPEFQNYIRENNQAHIENNPALSRGRVNHSSAGALHAIDCFQEKGRILAYLIAGHHTGLLNWHDCAEAQGKTPLSHRMAEEREQSRLGEVKNRPLPEYLLERQFPQSPPPQNAAEFGLSFWIRMLFSCLVDADFLDTEEFMDRDKSSLRNGYEDIAALKQKLDMFLEDMQSKATESDVNRERQHILAACRAKARDATGLFSLTVPTGGGKTLSSMAFALEHAIKHGQKRVIYVIPYTSIIEQNAAVFKGIFGEENVIEHHSSFDPDKETAKSRLACENWDAPVIVTTTVQFFESLFAARTSRVRKLHNIANSVVILDEAQLLPVELLAPILKAIDELAKNYKTSIVFCTATQPALSKKNPALKTCGLEDVREIIPEPEALAEKLRRVRIHPPKDWNTPREWEDIAEELAEHESVLCIVSRRDDARDLYRLLKDKTENHDGLYHLSALMCAAHRSDKIAEIKQRLKNKEPTRVVSTQLVEAGVDVDFPVVYRAMAGLDSIAQAAGRCNREGNLGTGGGKVVIFIPPTPPPIGILRKSAESGREIFRWLEQEAISFEAPQVFECFFDNFYSSANNLDKKEILHDLKMQGTLEFQFLSAAQKFQIIENAFRENVIVLYKDSPDIIEGLKNTDCYNRRFLRKLQRYTVQIPRLWHQKMLNSTDIEEILPGIFVQKVDFLYHQGLGFTGDDTRFHAPENFIA